MLLPGTPSSPGSPGIPSRPSSPDFEKKKIINHGLI